MNAPVRDTIVGRHVEVITRTWLTVRCAKCRFEFEVETHPEWSPRTVRCKRYGCGRICRLDTAVRVPEAFPAGVVPIAPTRRIS